MLADPDTGHVVIDEPLVRRLVEVQFPQWSSLPVRAVDHGGVDNRTFRLGPSLSVRLPSAAGYTEQVAKEHRWLPVLAPQLPLPIPTPVARGVPGEGYPWDWSVYRWIDGDVAARTAVDDLTGFAVGLADFLTALGRIDPAGGPAAGTHNFFRGAPLTTYDAETRTAIERLRADVDPELATEAWEAALAATWTEAPAWFHGDVAAGNLLVRDARLSAVIDFGSSGVGDSSCDTVIAWTMFRGPSRAAYRATLPGDDALWARGRGWALWKALITVVATRGTDPAAAASAAHVVAEVLAEHRAISS
ncbi:MAG: aminoglycoside phosphotransferase family protein [bacterium]